MHPLLMGRGQAGRWVKAEAEYCGQFGLRRWGTTTVTLGHPKDPEQDFVDTSFLGGTPADTPWLLYP